MKDRRLLKILSCLLAMMLVVLSVPENLISAFAEESNITWDFDSETGVLTLSGIGDMPDYKGYNNVPWNAHRDEIIKVEWSKPSCGKIWIPARRFVSGKR